MATPVTWLGGMSADSLGRAQTLRRSRRGASSRPIPGDPSVLAGQAQPPGPRALRAAGNHETHSRDSYPQEGLPRSVYNIITLVSPFLFCYNFLVRITGKTPLRRSKGTLGMHPVPLETLGGQVFRYDPLV
jgi:hypothetical protein